MAEKKEYYERRNEKLRAKQRKYRAENGDKVRANARRYYRDNAAELKRKKKAKYHENPEKYIRQTRGTKLRAEYGLSPEDYDAMVQKQGGVCAICKSPPVLHKNLSVDHCHDTGEVRGLLCHNCNTGLGHFRDSGWLLMMALEYLRASWSKPGLSPSSCTMSTDASKAGNSAKTVASAA